MNNSLGFSAHEGHYATIAHLSQVISCDNRHCDNRTAVPYGIMPDTRGIRPETAEVFDRLDALGIKQKELAAYVGVDENKLSKVRSGTRQFRAQELLKALEWLDRVERQGGYREEPDIPPNDPQKDYLPVDILPSFAGMGGGGTGDGDYGQALISRELIQDQLHAKPSDLLMIEARGDSMMPDFHHGDQILIDKRDCNPVQPGAFALWDGDGYVVKLVERVPQQSGRYRIFSANDRFSSYDVDADQVKIMGRPVWFGRRL